MKSSKIKELIIPSSLKCYTDRAILFCGSKWMVTNLPTGDEYVRRYHTFYLFNPMVWKDGVCRNANWWDITTDKGEYTTNDIREIGDKLLIKWERGRWYL